MPAVDITKELIKQLDDLLSAGGEERYQRELDKQQRAGLTKLPTGLRKYIQGQRVLSRYLRAELEDGAGMGSLMSYSETPAVLDQSLRAAGYVWTGKLWRLRKDRTAPREWADFQDMLRKRKNAKRG